MQFVEIEAECAPTLHRERAAQHLGSYKRIAVAVSANPASHAKKRRQLVGFGAGLIEREFVLEAGIETRDLAQELARDPGETASSDWRDYCPNGTTLNMLSTLQSCSQPNRDRNKSSDVMFDRMVVCVQNNSGPILTADDGLSEAL